MSKKPLDHLVICLTGAERVGKDTVSNYLVTKHGFIRYSVADPLKQTAQMILGLTDEQVHGDAKDELDPVLGIVPRDFLIWFGTDICRKAMHDRFPNMRIPNGTVWAAKMGRWVREQLLDATTKCRQARIVIPDIRFLAETDVLSTIPDAKLVLVKRDNGRPLMKYEIPAILENPATQPKYQLENNGSYDELYSNIDALLNKLANGDKLANIQ